MLRNLIAKITPNSGILRPMTVNEAWGAVPCRLMCSSNKSVDDWIASLPDDKQKRVQFIQNEIALRIAESKRMPKLELIEIEDYEEMLEMASNRRQRYYNYLWATKTKANHEDIKKAIRKAIKEEKIDLDLLYSKTNHIDYGIGRNTMLLKVTRQTMMKWRNLKLHRAIVLNEAPVIFDCGFSDEMTKTEIINAAQQIKHSFTENRLDRRPFVMNLCNVKKDSFFWDALNRQMPNIKGLPIKIHEADVIDVFPKDDLVYLSPDAEEMMEHFDCNRRYIIGCIVDKGPQKPLTLAKARRLNIRRVRLPLNKYINFHSHKTLTLNQMVSILLELKRSQDWSKALKYVPQRKIFG